MQDSVSNHAIPLGSEKASTESSGRSTTASWPGRRVPLIALLVFVGCYLGAAAGAGIRHKHIPPIIKGQSFRVSKPGGKGGSHSVGCESIDVTAVPFRHKKVAAGVKCQSSRAIQTGSCARDLESRSCSKMTRWRASRTRNSRRLASCGCCNGDVGRPCPSKLLNR